MTEQKKITWKERLVSKLPKFDKRFILEIVAIIFFFIFVIFNEFTCNTKYFNGSNSGFKADVKK